MSMPDRLVKPESIKKRMHTWTSKWKSVINQSDTATKSRAGVGNLYFAKGIGEGESRIDQVDIKRAV